MLLTAGIHVWAQQNQSEVACRIWVQDRILSQKPKLQKHLEDRNYQVISINQPPKLEQMDRLYDLALYPARDQKVHAYMTLTSKALADLGAIYYQPEQLPHCRNLGAFGDESYFRGSIGRQARARLDAYYSSGKSPMGMGELFLQAETLRFFGIRGFPPMYKKLVQDYRALVKEVKRTWDAAGRRSSDPLERIESVRKLLHPFYQNYVESQPSLTFAIQAPYVGNCQSSTQLFLFTLIDAGIDLGPDWELGAQLFRDHVQPVLYNKKKDHIQDLVSGSKVPPKAPVYSPELLTYALGRSTGRAVYTERESNLLLRKIDFKYAHKMWLFNYWILDQRTYSTANWRDPFYLVYDPSFSLASNGTPNPKAATLPFKGMSEEELESPFQFALPDMPDIESLSTLKQFKDQMSGRDAFGNKIDGQDVLAEIEKRGNLGTPSSNVGSHGTAASFLDPNFFQIVTEKYWQAYPVNERPDMKDAQEEAIRAISLEGNQKDLMLPSKVYVRTAKISEFADFVEDLTILISASNLPEYEYLKLGDKQLKVWNQRFKVSIKDTNILTRIKESRAYWSVKSTIENVLTEEFVERFHQMNQSTPLKVYTYLAGQDSAPTLPELKNFDRELNRFLAPLAEMKKMDSYRTFPKEDPSYCEYRNKLKRGETLSNAQIYSTLQRIKQLDPETHRAYFGMLSKLENSEEMFSRLGNCQTSFAETQVAQILGRIVLDSLEKKDIKILEPMSVVYPKLVFGESKQKLEKPKDALEGKVLQRDGKVTSKLNLTPPVQSITDFQSETLMGLLMSAEQKVLRHPVVQIVAIEWLTDKNIAYLAQSWQNSELPSEMLSTLLDTSVLIQKESWMSEPVRNHYRRQLSKAQVFVESNSPLSGSYPVSAALKNYVSQSPSKDLAKLQFTTTQTQKQFETRKGSANPVQQSCNWKGWQLGGIGGGQELSIDELLSQNLSSVNYEASASCRNNGINENGPTDRWEIIGYDYNMNRRTLITSRVGIVEEKGRLVLFDSSEEQNETQIRTMFAESRKDEVQELILVNEPPATQGPTK